MRKSSINWTWTDSDNLLGQGEESEVDLSVNYDYYKETPDVYYMSNGDPGYPGDPAEIDITDVFATSNLDVVKRLGDIGVKRRLIEILSEDERFKDAAVTQEIESDYGGDIEYEPMDDWDDQWPDVPELP
jgi:hypothetical protein